MHIPDLVKQLTAQYGTDNPFSICEKLDIPVIKTALPKSVNGLYKNNGGQKYIFISDALNENRAKFCCAHELGHALLHESQNSIFLSTSTYFRTEKFEKQADTFAVYLLLEDADVLYDRLGICTLDQIASYYNLDKKIVRLRYEN